MMIPCPKTLAGWPAFQDGLKDRFPEAKEREKMASFSFFAHNWTAKDASEVKFPDKATALGYFKPQVKEAQDAIEARGGKEDRGIERENQRYGQTGHVTQREELASRNVSDTVSPDVRGQEKERDLAADKIETTKLGDLSNKGDYNEHAVTEAFALAVGEHDISSSNKAGWKTILERLRREDVEKYGEQDSRLASVRLSDSFGKTERFRAIHAVGASNQISIVPIEYVEWGGVRTDRGILISDHPDAEYLTVHEIGHELNRRKDVSFLSLIKEIDRNSTKRQEWHDDLMSRPDVRKIYGQNAVENLGLQNKRILSVSDRKRIAEEVQRAIDEEISAAYIGGMDMGDCYKDEAKALKLRSEIFNRIMSPTGSAEKTTGISGPPKYGDISAEYAELIQKSEEEKELPSKAATIGHTLGKALGKEEATVKAEQKAERVKETTAERMARLEEMGKARIEKVKARAESAVLGARIGERAKGREEARKEVAPKEYARGSKEARAASDVVIGGLKQQLVDMKKTYKETDAWLAADQEKVRSQMVEAVNKLLPPDERGAFVNRITQAMKRPSIEKGDPESMYERSAKVIQEISDKADEVWKKDAIADIRKVASRAVDSPSVDLKVKNLIRRILADINLKKVTEATKDKLQKTKEFLDKMESAGKDVYLPEKIRKSIDDLGKGNIRDMDISAIATLQTNLRLAEKLGHTKFKDRQASKEAEREEKINEMLAGPSAPIEANKEIFPQPMTSLKAKERFANWMGEQEDNWRILLIRGPQSQNKFFDTMQGSRGTFAGPLFDHISNPMSAAFDAYRREFDPLRESFDKIQEEQKFTPEDETGIGTYMHLRQEGGEERLMAETGVTKESIEAVRKRAETDKRWQVWIKAWDDYQKQVFPRLQQFLYDAYNIDITPVENRFPWMRDWHKYVSDPTNPIADKRTGRPLSEEEVESLGQVLGNFHAYNTSKLKQGFILERKPHAKTAIRLDAFDVAEADQRNVLRLLNMQEKAIQVGKMLRDPRFREKYGDMGQELALKWLTTTVTDGHGAGAHRWPALDKMRRGTSRAMVLYRLLPNIKHTSSVPLAAYHAGGLNYLYDGFHYQMTPEGKEFLRMFPQVFSRQAGSITYAEMRARADFYGFYAGRFFDASIARATFIGRFLKELKAMGRVPTLDQDDIADATDPSTPIGKAAYTAANRMTRAVSSTLPKDMQPMLTQGLGFGGNISIPRAIAQFGLFRLERYSNVLDIPKTFKRSPMAGLGLLLALASTVAWEAAITAGGATISYLLLPESAKKKVRKAKTFGEEFVHRAVEDVLSWPPYMSNILAAWRYGESGVPAEDTIIGLLRSAKQIYTAKKPETKERAAIRAAAAGAEVLGGLGVPGLYAIPTFESLAEAALAESQDQPAGAPMSSQQIDAAIRKQDARMRNPPSPEKTLQRRMDRLKKAGYR